MVGIGVLTAIPDMDTEVEERVARQRLEEVSEEYNMGIEDVELGFDYSLPEHVMGRTEHHPLYGTKITVGQSFLDASENEQLKTMAHEGFHFKHFNGEATDWLEQEFNPSDQLLNEVEKSRRSGTEEDIEGITEVVTDNILPFDSQTGYPYLKRQKEAELKQKGVDVESELVQDIEDEIAGVIEQYKDTYQSFVGGNIYMEHGEIGDMEYSAIAIGYEDPEETVNNYLEDMIIYEEDEPELDLSEYTGEPLEYLEEEFDPESGAEYNEDEGIEGSVSMDDLEDAMTAERAV